jgi:hypothetical protein
MPGSQNEGPVSKNQPGCLIGNFGRAQILRRRGGNKNSNSKEILVPHRGGHGLCPGSEQLFHAPSAPTRGGQTSE